jgi:hypothetical protein
MTRRVAVLVFLEALAAWAWLGWRALTGPETHTAAGARTLAFVVMVGAGWTAFPFRRDDNDEEQF